MSKREKLSVEPYKGVRDFYPKDQAFLNYLLTTYRGVVERFGYVEYHASVLEPAELYKSKGAENAELVNEQTYTFLDRGGREVTLRPEMTPTVARMVAARRRDLGFPLRLFSIPNVFRYERPQRGRLREHWQLNVDIFGSQSLAAEAEVMAIAAELMRAFGAQESDFSIKIGSRTYLNTIITNANLSEAEARQLLLLLDRKAKVPTEEFSAGLLELGIDESLFTTHEEPEDVRAVRELLSQMGVMNAVFDPSIVRGFNYYTGIVFEVFDTHPDNNRALFGGGRYDNLLEMFDEEMVTGVGFGMGDVTMHDFLAVRGLLPQYTPPTKVYLAVTAPEMVPHAIRIAGLLRNQGVAVGVDFGDRKLGDQIKIANKHGILYLLVVGENEVSEGSFVVRHLETGDETPLNGSSLGTFFLSL